MAYYNMGMVCSVVSVMRRTEQQWGSENHVDRHGHPKTGIGQENGAATRSTSFFEYLSYFHYVQFYTCGTHDVIIFISRACTFLRGSGASWFDWEKTSSLGR